MSRDSDIAEMGRFLTARRKDRHSNWKETNMKVLRDSEIPFRETNGGETILFREDGVCIDFYPSTGRWREPRKNKTYRGGASALLRFMGKE